MKKILVIEDDPIVAHIYRSRLEREGFTVEVANDGQSGFYRVHEGRPDGILLDLMLPKMNGIELLRKIRVQSSYQALPVIVFTNAFVPSMVQDAFDAGATAVYNKSTLTPRQIVDALGVHLFPAAAASNASGKPVNGSQSPTATIPTASLPAAVADLAPSPVTCPKPLPPDFAAVSPFASPPPPPVSIDADSYAELRRIFFEQIPEQLLAIRKQLAEFTKATEEGGRLPALAELYRLVHSLAGRAGLAGLSQVTQMATALEALLKELHDKPKSSTPSTLRTVAQAVDFLNELCGSPPDLKPDDQPPIQILVVDDDLLARRAMTLALQRAFLKSDSVETAEAALTLAVRQVYDVIFLDVLMPGTPGFALCEKIRSGGPNRLTPVIFVTSQTDFNTRAQSALSGGNDLIAKPFLFIEVAVKALTFALRGRLKQSRAVPN